MEFKIKPSLKSEYPFGGVLIKHPSAEYWLSELTAMGFSIEKTVIYPLPNVEPNSVWGCLALHRGKVEDVRNNAYCQQVFSNLFIPENATLEPAVSEQEWARLVSSNNKYIIHPEFGMTELTETMDWVGSSVLPQPCVVTVRKPAEGVFIPQQIKSFQVNPISAEEVMAELEKKIVPQKEKLKEEKPLTSFEKMKMEMLKKILGNGNPTSGSGTGGGLGEGLGGILGGAMGAIGSLLDKITPGFVNNMVDRMEQNLEELERRNQTELERFFDLLKNNPEEALKYAIPLDNNNSGRGGDFEGELNLSKRWYDFSLFGSSNQPPSGGGGGALRTDSFQQLYNEYARNAQAFMEKGEYEKAAFVYMKLLKNYNLAADAMERGKFYKEAAEIYKKYAHNRPKAAECYEKASIFSEAIEIHKELRNFEKVGDLYMVLNKKEDAFKFYTDVAEDYIKRNQYVKASILYREKMEDRINAQSSLLRGWDNDTDALNCLGLYLANIEKTKERGDAFQHIYHEKTNPKNIALFLKTVKDEFERDNELAPDLKEMAFEIISKQSKVTPTIVSELKVFNKADKNVIKDAMRFQRQNK